jgi:pimeloyl-ACP methyl ester carboxylesterase
VRNNHLKLPRLPGRRSERVESHFSAMPLRTRLSPSAGDGDIALLESGARACGDYVVGEYRFEVLKGVSHWILDDQPDKMADLLLDWFASHPAESRQR